MNWEVTLTITGRPHFLTNFLDYLQEECGREITTAATPTAVESCTVVVTSERGARAVAGHFQDWFERFYPEIGRIDPRVAPVSDDAEAPANY